MSKTIDTDNWTFIRFWSIPIVILLFFFFIEKAMEGLIVIGISIFLALALRPLVKRVNDFFTKHFGNDDKHKTLSAIFAYLIVILVIGFIIAIIGPVVVEETAKFINNFPETFEKTLGGWDGINSFGRSIGVDNLQGEIMNNVENISHSLLGVLGSNLVSSVSGVAGIIMKVVLVLILTLLFLLEGPGIVSKMWNNLDDKKERRKTIAVERRTIGKMADVVSTYVSHQLIVAFLDGCATMVIVFILSLIMSFSPSLAVPMGLITMIFYMIPMFGQFIGGTLVTVLLFFSNPFAALIFAVIYIVYAQIENNIIAPKIQGDALNLSPLIILCAIVIGMYMFGLLGAIIAIPIAGCIKVLVEEYPHLKAARRE